jgi:Flp pilus assembly pilin Flp
MLQAVARLRALAGDDQGQDLTEYGLLAGLIALVAIAAIGSFGTAATNMWTGIVDGLRAALG